MANKVTPDFVIASSANFTGFHSTNLKVKVHGYAPRNVADCAEFLRENWPGSTITSDSMFDDIKDRRAYTERDIIYTNKIRTRLKKLEEEKLLLTNKKLNDTLSR